MSSSAAAIEACLERVRRHAQLDAHPVLPPLNVIAGQPQVHAMRGGAGYHHAASPTGGMSMQRIPLHARPHTDVVSAEATTDPREDVTRSSKRSRRRRLTWPVVFCGFVGGVFGGASLMMSPLAQTPAVERAIDVATTHYDDAKSFVKAIL